jgi:uncharacterized protein
MRPIMIIIIITILAVYFFGNWYVFSKGLSVIDDASYRRLFIWAFWIMSGSFMLGQYLERGNPGNAERFISYVGSTWLVVLWYALLMVAFIDLINLLNNWFHFIPQQLSSGLLSGKMLFIYVFTIVVSLAVGGYVNALNPGFSKINLDLDKTGIKEKQLKIALVTDIHMGAIISNHRVKKMVRMLNQVDPDLILFAGDLVDHNPKPVIKRMMGEHFLDLKPKYGTYAVAGNHEFIGHPEISINYLEQYGISYLRDTMIKVGDAFYLAGRDDKDKPRFSEGEMRKPLNEIINKNTDELPLILMDHQPVEYQMVREMGVDLMVSGHTHKGQFWPFNLITSLLYENHYGLMNKGKTNYYTSSGFGTWGPPIRIGNRPEIVEIILNLK